MVKIDYARDYYADLEASPTDSIDALKKQYRKLGMSARASLVTSWDYLVLMAFPSSQVPP